MTVVWLYCVNLLSALYFFIVLVCFILLCFAILCYVLMIFVTDPHINELRQFKEFVLPTTHKQQEQEQEFQQHPQHFRETNFLLGDPRHPSSVSAGPRRQSSDLPLGDLTFRFAPSVNCLQLASN